MRARKPAKNEPQTVENQSVDEFSGQQLVLLQSYQVAYAIFYGMQYGQGTRPELAKELDRAGLPVAPRRLAEPQLFDRLMKAGAVRTVRQVVNASKSLRTNEVGQLLREQPTKLLQIKSNKRFPKNRDKQIEYLARTFGALLAGYEPNTGIRYLGAIDRCLYCHERPAVIDFARDGRPLRPWCGMC